MPTSKLEIAKLKTILITYFGLEDRSDTWLTVCGQLTAIPISKRRISYQRLAIAAERLLINALIQEEKLVEYEKLEAKLKSTMKKTVDAATNVQ